MNNNTSLGRHLLLDCQGISPELLNNEAGIRSAILEAIAACSATLIDLCVHKFSPHGVTAAATLAESHLALHTWPEKGVLAADLFFCGDGDIMAAVNVLLAHFHPDEHTLQCIERGSRATFNTNATETSSQ